LFTVDPDDETDWPRQHAWLAKQLNKLHQLFAGRIGSLDNERHEDAL